MSEENEAVALLPCPFCGGSPWVHEYKERHSARVTGWLVTCKECGAEASHTADVRETAFEAWNRRTDCSDSTVTITALQSQVRTLTEALDRQNGTPCEQIRHQHEVEALNEKLATQRDQSAFIVETLRADLASARAEVEMLREALSRISKACARKSERPQTCVSVIEDMSGIGVGGECLAHRSLRHVLAKVADEALAPQTKEDE